MFYRLFPKLFLCGALVGASCLFACSKSPQTTVAPIPDVAVETAIQAPVPLQLNYSGHTAGSREVEVRSRVSGILLKRRYQEGSRVEKDSVLFELDPEPARAAAEQASAEVEVQRALAAQA